MAALRFSGRTDLPEAGLQLRLMTGVMPQPPTPPEVFVYEFRRDNRTWREERFDPRVLWMQTQLCGQWVDPHGNRLWVAALAVPYPSSLPPHVPRQAFEEQLTASRLPADRWSFPQIEQWLRDFTSSAPATLLQQSITHSRLRTLMLAEFAPESRLLAYVFRLNRSALDQRYAPDQWFAAVFLLAPDVDRARAIASVENSFLPSIAGSKPAGTTSQDNSVPATAKDSAERSARFLASKEAAIRSIRNLKDWWYDETDNYILLSNLSARHRVTVRQIKENLELMRTVYARLLPARVKVGEVSTVRVFETPEEYASYLGPDYAWTAGLWAPARRELVIRSSDWGGSKEQRQRLLSTIYHEAFHQYIFYSLDMAHVSAWFNEGHASFFEHADIRSNRVIMQEDARKARLMESMVQQKEIDIPRLLQLSYADFYAQDEAVREKNYTLAWGLAYYLHKGTRLEPNHPHAQIVGRYLDTLWKTRDPAGATTAAFEGVNMDVLTEQFSRFWKSSSRRSFAHKPLIEEL